VRYVKNNKMKRRKGYIGVSRQSLRSLWGELCYLCNEPMVFESKHRDHPRYATMEHIVPRSQGGKKSWDNIRLSCRECNSAKRDLSLEEYFAERYGEHVPEGMDPLDWVMQKRAEAQDEQP
jgi:5-methylcytosine-specific restriction endonuclease McrA